MVVAVHVTMKVIMAVPWQWLLPWREFAAAVTVTMSATTGKDSDIESESDGDNDNKSVSDDGIDSILVPKCYKYSRVTVAGKTCPSNFKKDWKTFFNLTRHFGPDVKYFMLKYVKLGLLTTSPPASCWKIIISAGRKFPHS